MCHLWWTPAHLRQKACNQKYELAFQKDHTRAFELIQIMTTSLKNKLTFKNHVHFGHHQQKVFHQPKLVRFTFSICLLSSCSLLSLISPLHLVRQVMDSKFPCWICRRSWDCKASGRECATLSALHCCTVFQCAHLYTTLMCFTLIWSAFQYLCFHRLVLHLTFPSVNWTNYPPPTSQAHSTHGGLSSTLMSVLLDSKLIHRFLQVGFVNLLNLLLIELLKHTQHMAGSQVHWCSSCWTVSRNRIMQIGFKGHGNIWPYHQSA